MSITPKNWKSFQHYKDRAPAWIKLHKGLLDDFAFARLPIASKALAPMLWLLASEYDDGAITASFDEIAFRLRWSDDEFKLALKPLIDAGFFIDASNSLADCKQDACLEKEKREREREEKEEEIDSEPIGSAVAVAPPAEAEVDFRKKLFSDGLSRLSKLTGKGPDACRSFVGKCLKAAGDDAVTVLGLIEDAERNQVVDPSSWIVARLPSRSTGPPVRATTVFQKNQQTLQDIRNELGDYARRSGESDKSVAKLLS